MEEQDSALFDQIKHLYNTWPADGWDGAAALISAHAKKARAIEQEFKLRHTTLGKHGPEHPYYKGQCVCREKL